MDSLNIVPASISVHFKGNTEGSINYNKSFFCWRECHICCSLKATFHWIKSVLAFLINIQCYPVHLQSIKARNRLYRLSNYDRGVKSIWFFYYQGYISVRTVTLIEKEYLKNLIRRYCFETLRCGASLQSDNNNNWIRFKAIEKLNR